MSAPVLPLPVSLLPLVRLPVATLRFPVIPPYPFYPALLTAVDLSSPATPANQKNQPASSTMNLDQQKNRPPILQKDRKPYKIKMFCFLLPPSLRSCCRKPEAATSGFRFLCHWNYQDCKIA